MLKALNFRAITNISQYYDNDTLDSIRMYANYHEIRNTNGRMSIELYETLRNDVKELKSLLEELGYEVDTDFSLLDSLKSLQNANASFMIHGVPTIELLNERIEFMDRKQSIPELTQLEIMHYRWKNQEDLVEQLQSDIEYLETRQKLLKDEAMEVVGSLEKYKIRYRQLLDANQDRMKELDIAHAKIDRLETIIKDSLLHHEELISTLNYIEEFHSWNAVKQFFWLIFIAFMTLFSYMYKFLFKILAKEQKSDVTDTSKAREFLHRIDKQFIRDFIPE
eukprot:TRINITY_DN3569_c0_g1_i2.p1 TRINITY_DN3569_c0_g1~~TRINITY_DN3569_c0_g1_i2.p1  ORF type:complete len:279 (+),score=56.85 TRINITY_DN3569_c0_g1_i2:574-1410(+)